MKAGNGITNHQHTYKLKNNGTILNYYSRYQINFYSYIILLGLKLLSDYKTGRKTGTK